MLQVKTMKQVTVKKIRLLFWGTVVLGIILPIAIMVSVDFALNHEDFITVLLSSISFFSLKWGLILMLHDIPFIALAFLIRSQLQEKTESPKPSVLRLSETLGAGIVMVGFSLFLNLSIWIWNTSTAVLAYFTFPFYGIISILIGYGGGWVLGKIIVGVRR